MRHDGARTRPPGEAKSADGIEAAFHELSAGFTPAQKRVFGEFIHLLQRESFEAGLRAGLVSGLFPKRLDSEDS